jgi:peptidoglycan/LPS O-acetylase OafA/YrhL
MRPSIPALTSLRFFAALVVVLFHYTLGRPESLGRVWDFGYQAVTFFFILSGFILVYAHGKPEGGLNVLPKTFFKARLVRICPAYYLAILMIVLLFFAVGVLDRITPIPFALVLTMLQSWTPTSALSLNPPAWSLSNEVFFYLLFPALWRVTHRMSLIASLAASASIILLASFGRGLVVTSEAESWNNLRLYFPMFNFPKFMLGVSLGYAFVTAPRSQCSHGAFFLAGIAALVVLVVLRSTAGWSPNGVALDVICGSIIFGAAGSGGLTEKMLSYRPLVILGEASYATYILHFPIWLWWNHYTRIVHKADWPLAFDLAMYMLIVFFFSIAVLFWIERPARRRLRD